MPKVKDIVDFSHFNSLSEFVAYCDGRSEEDLNRISSRSSDTGTQKFTHTETYEEASALVRNGWPEGVKQLSSMLEVMRERMTMSEARSVEMDICGPIAITGAYCSGDPECMLNPAEVVERPAVTLIFDFSTPASTPAHTIVNRGAAILALAEALERNGQRVEIYASSVGRIKNMTFTEAPESSDAHTVCIVKLKDAQDEFNIHSLSYAMVHPSMLRRHYFRYMERMPILKNGLGGYGNSRKLTDIEGIENAVGDIDLYFPQLSNTYDYGTWERALETVMNIAKEKGLIGA